MVLKLLINNTQFKKINYLTVKIKKIFLHDPTLIARINIYLKLMKKRSDKVEILITGGTSGLGLELVRLFLKNGFHVISMGRKQIDIPGYENRYKLYQVDFSDLEKVAKTTKQICENHEIDIVINNAGVLSPPAYTQTINCFEYTLQVNYLSHLLINEVVVKKVRNNKQLRIAAVTSPLYMLADRDLEMKYSEQSYSILNAYSSSKLYLVLMCQFFPLRHPEQNLKCFSFNPGIFSSGIYRMQKKWFWRLYYLGSPFMKSPGIVAKILLEILTEEEIINGHIYHTRKRPVPIPLIDTSKKEVFFKTSYEMIGPYLKQVGDIN